MKVAIYARVSTEDKGQDTENQLLQLRELCERRGWTIIHEYIDEMSGKTSNRPQFQAMFKDARHRKFHLVLFWALDRFTREGALETLQHLQRLTSLGVDWMSFTEQYLDSTGIFKDAIIGILATIAKQERIRLSDRTKAGMEKARKNGAAIGRPRCDLDVQAIRDKRAAGGSIASISAELGVSGMTVRRVLAATGRVA